MKKIFYKCEQYNIPMTETETHAEDPQDIAEETIEEFADSLTLDDGDEVKFSIYDENKEILGDFKAFVEFSYSFTVEEE